MLVCKKYWGQSISSTGAIGGMAVAKIREFENWVLTSECNSITADSCSACCFSWSLRSYSPASAAWSGRCARRFQCQSMRSFLVSPDEVSFKSPEHDGAPVRPASPSGGCQAMKSRSQVLKLNKSDILDQESGQILRSKEETRRPAGAGIRNSEFRPNLGGASVIKECQLCAKLRSGASILPKFAVTPSRIRSRRPRSAVASFTR